MKKCIDKKAAIKVVIEAAKNYEKYLKDKHFLIIYQQGKNIQSVHIGFRDINFLHLTGIKTKLSAKRFYSACIAGKLSEKDIALSKNGTTQQKLTVLPYLHGVLYHNCMIGYFVNSGVYIRADYFVGDTKAVLSIGIREGKTTDIPVTLYKENVKMLVSPAYKVLAIFSKKYNENKYTSCTYLSKGQKIEEFSQYCS